ncbi:MAG: zinc-dependent metalloprotease [Chloroflexota bacterium]|nr:zinc-dependent metalloprotease [Chloroflexota bacterium]
MKAYAGQDRPDGMIDWTRSHDIAVRMNRGDVLNAAERQRLDAYYGDLVERCVPIVTEYTGSSLPSTDQRTFAFDRIDWINANLDGFKQMFEPIQALDSPVGKNGTANRLMSGVNQNILSYEVGLLLGYLAKRVLGQYDLALLGREPVSAGKLYYVEPNIRGTEAKLGLPRDDFRMWLALHETTHAFEFEAHPWVRLHFNSLLERYMAFMKQDAEYLKQGMEGLKVFAQRVRNGRTENSSGSWIESFMNEDQRALFNEMQAMMCVVEGYSNHVMNAVGKTLLENYDLISRKFEERQKQRTQAEQLFARLTGLDVKMEQYRAGERFIDEIVRQRSHDLARRVWEAPEFLPTMKEIRNPQLWIARVEAPAVLPVSVS